MQLSRNWLAEYVELPASVEDLARDLTLAGFAVEGIEEAGDDVLLDVDVTTNRPDAMNHLGLAREVAVVTGRPLEPPAVELAEAAERIEDAASVTIEDGTGCPRYVARVVRGVRVGQSPPWLKRRLTAIGLRPINNVVDVTNFVLWETGQPLHAFDLGKLAGGEIRVRRARRGETLVTLDEEERELDPELLVIADAERPVALAGVIGGLASEVSGATRDVLIESAHFRPRDVRVMARRLGMKTDASHRFERGADPGTCRWAADRAAALIAELAGGEVLAGALDARGEPLEPRRGRLELDRLDRFAGVEIPAAEVERILGGLGFRLEPAGAGVWEVAVPTWRHYDFEPRPEPPREIYPADLYEEVLRVHGFDAVPATLPEVQEPDGPPTAAQRRRERIREHLAACGYAEAIHFAFHDRESDARYPCLEPEAAALELDNPVSELYAVMRRSLVPNLIGSARFNRRRGSAAVSLFEIGRVFFAADGGEVEEPEMLALIAGGRRGTPWDRPRELDLFDLKGALESLAGALGTEIGTRPAELPGLVAGTGAELLIAGRRVGWLGRIEEEDGDLPLFAAELATGALGGRRELTVELPSRHPGIAADLTLTHSLDVPWGEIRDAVTGSRPEDLVEVGLKDRYRGEGVPAGAVNTTLYFVYNSSERSLTQEEVNERQATVAAELERRFGWRG